MVQQRYVVKAAAWLEIVVGAIFVVAPDIPCILLFDAKPENIGRPLARWVGVSLFALGFACLPLTAGALHRSAVLGLFLYNAGLAVVLAYLGTVTSVHGFLLWPVVILHALIAVMLLPLLLSTRGWWHVAAQIDEATTRQHKV
jgi:hypothetical protein